MKKAIVSMTVVGLLMTSGAMAVELPKDAPSKCGTCHAMSSKSLGPSWVEMAKKFKGVAGAEKTLVENITKGGKFGWNMSSMPAKGMGATPEQIAVFAKFIAVEMNAPAPAPK